MLKKENTIIAGGSDVMPQLKTATIAPEALIDLSKISEMHTVEETDDGIYIGAMVALSHLAKNELILRKLIALSQAARNVASPQIRNRGTVGGNLMQARRCFYYNQTKEWRRGIPVCFKVGGDRCIQIPNSPVCRAIYYSDMAPALIAYGAQALVHTAEGSQLVSCQELMETHCKDQDKPMLIEKCLFGCLGQVRQVQPARQHRLSYHQFCLRPQRPGCLSHRRRHCNACIGACADRGIPQCTGQRFLGRGSHQNRS